MSRRRRGGGRERPGREPPNDDYQVAVREQYVPLARLAYALCGDRQRAEDAVAEAFARVYVRWSDGKVDDLGAYLRRAVVNQVHSRHRRLRLERDEQNRRRVDWRDGQRFDEQLGDRDVLLAALRTLPEIQQAVVVLRIVKDHSEDETARMLGIRRGTVKSRLSRAMDTLRELLGEEGDDV
ncbi:MAG: sigma-70 family RNA polymerase sigma factor [Actinomycetota bacterium]|nr:sigma-70 family RNA polymerase sigma factor [Actinomycetota bacterium]